MASGPCGIMAVGPCGIMAVGPCGIMAVGPCGIMAVEPCGIMAAWWWARRYPGCCVVYSFSMFQIWCASGFIKRCDKPHLPLLVSFLWSGGIINFKNECV